MTGPIIFGSIIAATILVLIVDRSASIGRTLWTVGVIGTLAAALIGVATTGNAQWLIFGLPSCVIIGKCWRLG